MITSSSIQYISQVFNEPQNISANDKDSIDALIQAFPYFVPARYMDAAKEHQKQPFNADVMAEMQLYMGNWLLYNQFLHAAAGDIAPVTAQAQQTSAVDVAPVEEIQTPEQTIAEDQSEATEAFVIPDEGFIQPEAVTAEELPSQLEALIDAREAEPIIEAAVVEGPVAEATAFVEAEPATTTPQQPKKETLYRSEDFTPDADESFILPVYTEDYFLHQGMHVSNDIPDDIPKAEVADEAKQLMVVMSFSEWLSYFKNRREKEAEEIKDQKAVKTMWQKEKLAAAMEEENEEIPEKVFEMAVNSITKEDDLASESLAEIHTKQGRYDKAIEMYRKLSLRNPQKKAYFARKIEIIQKEKGS